MCLCFQLEILLSARDSRSVDHPSHELISEILAKTYPILASINPNYELIKFIEDRNLTTAFPHLIKFIDPLKRLIDTSIVLDYFGQIAILNQVVAMSDQLQNDIHQSKNHKYVAHQVALLYQCLIQLGEAGVSYKKKGLKKDLMK